jgi:hypothetical protein
VPTTSDKETTVTDATQPADETEGSGQSDAPSTATRRRRPRKGNMRATAKTVRAKVASIVWLVAVVCALFLAVGALFVALKMNQDNAVVAFVIDVAKKLDFGELKQFTGKDAAVKSALTNWGIAAVIYLVIGKLLDRVIRP